MHASGWVEHAEGAFEGLGRGQARDTSGSGFRRESGLSDWRPEPELGENVSCPASVVGPHLVVPALLDAPLAVQLIIPGNRAAEEGEGHWIHLVDRRLRLCPA